MFKINYNPYVLSCLAGQSIREGFSLTRSPQRFTTQRAAKTSNLGACSYANPKGGL